MVVLQVCAYGADYEGNFISSLEALDTALELKGIHTIYAFIDRASDKPWCKKIQERTTVYFLPESHARILPETYKIFRKIYSENDIGIVHTHFELYDIPATIMAPKNVKVFWHLHDPIVVEKNLRGLLWKIQYGCVGRKANLLSVSEHYKERVIKLGFPRKQAFTLINGIDLSRIRKCDTGTTKPYDFLTFGWDFYRKGSDLILAACEQLEKEGYKFRILLNGGDHTWKSVDQYLVGKHPEYLTKGEPVRDVSNLFEKTAVFIQASRRETFSYALCEAAYAGLPIICSDIPGVEWAHNLDSTFFFENESKEQLYALMKRYLDGNMQITNDAVANSRDIIERKYSTNVWVEQVIQRYES